MGIANITKYYKLEPVYVTPGQLLLDPTNPRIIIDAKDNIDYPESKLALPKVQDDILKIINKDEYNVAKLIKDVRNTGFINAGQHMIVKKISFSNKYLVIEGNRRTTAIKHLLQDPKKLDKSVLKSLQEIKVQQFLFTQNEYFSEEDIIDVILGKIHVSGPMKWGAMEKTYHIYKTYMRELGMLNGSNTSVPNDLCIDKVLEIYPFLDRKDIIISLCIYKVYSQLKRNDYEVKTGHFTLIDLAVSDKTISKDYFHLNELDKMSDVGLERFNKLCIEDNCQITNPKLWNKFKDIYKHGSENDIRQIESGISGIEELHSDIKDRKKGNYFLSKIEGILKKIEKLNIDKFQGSKKEIMVAGKIISLVNNKLARLIDVEGTDSDAEEITLPNDASLLEEEVYTVAELFEKRMELDNEYVVLKGMVDRVVITANDEEEYRLFIQDEVGTDDILITTTDHRMVGETVTIRGRFFFNKKLEDGYTYPAVIEAEQVLD